VQEIRCTQDDDGEEEVGDDDDQEEGNKKSNETVAWGSTRLVSIGMWVVSLWESERGKISFCQS
jgi:hypothetical protein